MQEGLGLPHVQVTDHPLIAVVLDQAGFAAGGARQFAGVVIDGDVGLLAGDINVDPRDVPWGTQSKQGGQEFFVSHGWSLCAR